eukprot:TRINITY_DN7563_c1_g1_i4.p1 TRINITY_DN7563_c1_g1~~TRINITY_DN7563_c1_g1_i4.p1  ORF type:complete len:149 (+),score=25.66 TRINITY_DN7563_c1_g1_i4:44-490(+)
MALSILEVQRIVRQREVQRLLKWIMVGAIGAVVDFSVLNFLVSACDWVPYYANPISFTAAVISNFFLNRFWTFPESRKLPMLGQAIQFFLISMTGLMINQAIFVIVLGNMGPYLSPPWDFNFSKAVAIAVVLFWNFFANRYWTYAAIK